MTEATERGVTPEERLAKALIRTDDEDPGVFDDVAIDDEAAVTVARGLIAALRSEGIYLVSRDELAEALRRLRIGCLEAVVDGTPMDPDDDHRTHDHDAARLLDELDRLESR